MGKKSSRRDLLSNLPLDIIHIILSFVPIRDAIRTSLLSRKWRYIWNSLPHLAFDDESLNSPMETESDKKRLSDFIGEALLHHEGPIRKFQLRLPFRSDSLCVDLFLLFCSMNGIRTLILEFDYIVPGIEVHFSLYSCQNLTHLKLHVYTFPLPRPSFKGFLFLRSLDICSSNVDSSTIESIVAHSPLLEQLKLISMEQSEMTIRAPNLKFFRFGYRYTHLSLCAPLLEELKVYVFYIKRFSFPASSVFRHLRIIKVRDVRFNRTEVAMAVFRLITCSCNLHKLEIDTLPPREDNAPDLACKSFWDTEHVPNFTYDNLKVIKMTIFSCGTNEMKLIKFLLARSPVLERIIYRPGLPLSELEVLLDLTAKLRGFCRASENSEL